MSEDAENSLIKPVCLPWYQGLVAQLQNLQQQKRLPHAILLSLPGESDELGFLWHLSMSLLCSNHQDEQPCGECSSCHLMLSNTYPDFKLIGQQYDEGKKKLNRNIKIEQIRELIHEVYLTRSYDNLKIAVIYPADKMSIAGANSLLKTLEEPAENALIIVATHKPGKIPVTIRSRCQQWTLRLPSLEQGTQWLEAQGFDADKIGQYLELADGDPSLALRLHAIDYVELVKGFKQQFSQYLKNQIDVVKLSQFLIANEISLVRRLVAMVIKAYCYQYCGLQDSPDSGSLKRKQSAQAMFDLLTQIERQLMIEENNLDPQLQLEDVLISIKQIIIQS